MGSFGNIILCMCGKARKFLSCMILGSYALLYFLGTPGPSEFNIPHSLALAENHDRLYVADRENGRIQCFSLKGEYHMQIALKQFNGRLFAVTYSPSAGKYFLTLLVFI